MNQARFKKIISGQSPGSAAAALRFLLKVPAVFYGMGVALRNWLFDKGPAKSYAVTFAGLKTTDRTQATVPVISVGNITVGGTGKTPMVIWLSNFLREKNINCAILTRGYKAAKGGHSDEPAMLIKNCPGTAVVVNPDRLAGALEAVKRHRAQVLIIDDGFQHRRLHRDIDIVTIDATLPFGYNRVLPAGLLREPVSSLKRAHAAILTRCDSVSKDDLTKLTETIGRINPKLVVAQTIHAPVCVRTNDKDEIPLAKLKGKKVFAFCGIANPDAFLSTISRLKANLAGSKIYDDHHEYTARDFSEICREAAQSGAEMILTTEKDYNKITRFSDNKGGLVLAYLAVRVQFLSGQEQITQLIERSLAGKIFRK
ncbi:MAG: tetraacyldisaccharide 4'-kinase [Planctomycetota bacterium]